MKSLLRLLSLAVAIGALLLAPLWAQNGASGLIVNNAVNCATSVDGSVVGIANPLSTTGVSPVFSGTLPAGNYYIEYGWYDWVGKTTLVSPEQIQQLNSNGGLTIAPPSSGVPNGAAGMMVYIGGSSGAETLQGMTSGNESFTQSTPLNLTSAAPPAVNSTLCKVVANDALWPSGTGYQVSVTDSAGNPFPGYPIQWQLNGPGTQINLSQGTPYYHGITFYPAPVFASPLNHQTQSISGALSLGSYTLYSGGVNVLGNAGFSGVKVMGGCTVTIMGGVITNVAGC